MPRVKKIDHVGIAVRDAEAAARFYGEALGLAADHYETVPAQGVKVAFLPLGEATLELLEPTGPDTPVGKYLDKRGEGIHHICLEVEGLDELLGELSARGAVIGSGAATPGAHGSRVGFLHPKATGGVLVELAEKGHEPET